MEMLLAVVGNVWDQIGDMVTLITGSAILLVPLAFRFANQTIGSGKRLMGIGGRGRR